MRVSITVNANPMIMTHRFGVSPHNTELNFLLDQKLGNLDLTTLSDAQIRQHVRNVLLRVASGELQAGFPITEEEAQASIITVTR